MASITLGNPEHAFRSIRRREERERRSAGAGMDLAGVGVVWGIVLFFVLLAAYLLITGW